MYHIHNDQVYQPTHYIYDNYFDRCVMKHKNMQPEKRPRGAQFCRTNLKIGRVIFWLCFHAAKSKELLSEQKGWLTDVGHNSLLYLSVDVLVIKSITTYDS